jgi:site-specific recombinase XerD
LDLAPWISDYAAYLASHGYATHAIDIRRKHLDYLNRFIEARDLQTFEHFPPEWAIDFIDYWMRHHPAANKKVAGFQYKSRFEPHHHRDVQFSLRCFFRWAHAAGRLRHNPFPLRPLVTGHYFFPEMTDYLDFCKEHKGLARNSCKQIERLVRCFGQFLHSAGLTAWNQLQSAHIDAFVRQEAAHNVKRIQNTHALLSGLLRYLFSLGRLDRDWACTLRSPRRYQLARTPRALTADQVLHLLRSIDRSQRGGKRDLAIILMAASLGVRVSEIAALSLQHLDWVRGVVSFPPIKNQEVLPLPLSRPLIEALADYLKKERPAGSPYRNVFLALTPPLEPLAPVSVSAIISRRMRRTGIQGSGHGLRHAFASQLLRAGVSFPTLQQLLGHSHFSSTRVYTKIDLVQLRDVANNDAEDL